MENSPCRSLVKRQQFLNLKKFGVRLYPTSWMLLSYAANDGQGLCIGITASRKVGNAVIRNQLKRWIREFFRTLEPQDKELNWDINVVLRPQGVPFFKGLTHEEFDIALQKAWTRLRSKLCSTNKLSS